MNVRFQVGREYQIAQFELDFRISGKVQDVAVIEIWARVYREKRVKKLARECLCSRGRR